MDAATAAAAADALITRDATDTILRFSRGGGDSRGSEGLVPVLARAVLPTLRARTMSAGPIYGTPPPKCQIKRFLK